VIIEAPSPTIESYDHEGMFQAYHSTENFHEYLLEEQY